MKIIDEIVKRVQELNPDQKNEIIKSIQELNPDQTKIFLQGLRCLQGHRKREYQRLTQKIEVDAVVGNRVLQAETKNISAGGMYITTSGKFEIDKPVRLIFIIPNSGPIFKLKGKIVRVETDGIGIKFEKMSPLSKQILDKLLWKTTGTESVNENETHLIKN